MNTYVVFGEHKKLESLVKEHDIHVRYQSKHIPLLHIESDEPVEKIKEIFADYTVSPQKEY